MASSRIVVKSGIAACSCGGVGSDYDNGTSGRNIAKVSMSKRIFATEYCLEVLLNA